MTSQMLESTEEIVEQFVFQKARAGEMFTAHDITRAVRHQVGRHVNVPHDEVKEIVHGLFEDGELGDYARTLATFPGVSPVPWIYHRKGDNPADYKKPATDRPSGNYQGIDLGNIDSGLSIDVANESCHVDARDTLCIPAKFIRGIGMGAGQTAYVVGDPLNNFVKLTPFKPISGYAEYTVDRNCNVRITQPVLQRFGHAGKEYTVARDSNFVKIARKE